MKDLNSDKAIQAFYSLDRYPEFKKLASQYKIILDEIEGNSIWMNWGSDQYDPSGHCKFLKGNWTICPLYFGRSNPHFFHMPGLSTFEIDEFDRALPQKFPKITNLLKDIDSINFAAFSRLHPKSSLAPHRHQSPTSLIYHQGLKIPSGNSCGIKVGEKTHTWKKAGEAIIFNDNLEHSAWNHSDEERIILYIDFVA